MKPAPQKYRATNWKAYNAALKARGPLLIWLDPAMNWHGQGSGKHGRSPAFSNEAVQFCREKAEMRVTNDRFRPNRTSKTDRPKGRNAV